MVFILMNAIAYRFEVRKRSMCVKERERVGGWYLDWGRERLIEVKKVDEGNHFSIVITRV